MRQPLVVITGPTASGKTGLAVELASRYNGEIICADSRTLYKGMGVGTAKPTKKELETVPHHLLSVVDPGERYTAADFQIAAMQQIKAIRSRKHIPFLVGGTGLYIDAVVRQYEWPKQRENEHLHEKLETLTLEELTAIIRERQLLLPSNIKNKRHLIHTIIRDGKLGRAKLKPDDNTVVIAIATDRDVLRKRITERAHEMFKNGVIGETKNLAKTYGWGSEAMKSNVYPVVKQVIDGEISEAQAIELSVTKDMQLAKRQVTWLKRHDYVKWLTLEDARSHIETILE